MAVPTNTYTRFSAGTNVREDLIDRITMTNPEKTPVTSSFGRATADNTYTEWQRDNLRAFNKDNAAIDGDDATASAKTPPQRIGNVCQIFQDTIAVSDRAEKVKKAGMSSAMKYYQAKAYKELQRDLEAATLSANVAVMGSGGTASKMGGLGVLLYSNAQHGAGGSTVAHTSGAPTVAPTAGTARPFTEAILKTGLQAAYTAAGMTPTALYVSPNHKQTFSSFAGIAVNRVELRGNTQAKIIGGADVYLGDFGELTIVPHYVLAGSTMAFALDNDQNDVAYLRPYQSTPLGKTGDNTKVQVLMDATIRVLSENCQIKYADLTP